GEDRDPLLALQLAGVHRPLVVLVAVAEGSALGEHGVDQGGLAVIDVGDDGDVSQVGAVLDGHTQVLVSMCAAGRGPSSAWPQRVRPAPGPRRVYPPRDRVPRTGDETFDAPGTGRGGRALGAGPRGEPGCGAG